VKPPAPAAASVALVSPFQTLEQAADAVLELIAGDAGPALWTIAKAEGEHWIPLAGRDRHYGLKRGAPLAWLDALCARALAGELPLAIDPAAADPRLPPVLQTLAVEVGAYLLQPIHDADGSLFGVLFGCDPEPGRLDPLLLGCRADAAARVVTTYLSLEERIEDTRRRAERAELDSRTDPMTGVLNRRGWELAMAQEQARIARTGGASAVVLVDLDGLKRVNDSLGHEAGDALIVRCARVLAGQVRARDVVGRLGGDEFAMLLARIDRPMAGQVIERIRQSLIRAEVHCTLTWSWAGALGSLDEALAEADMLLIEHKKNCGRAALA
jgi:diguanylate cyclase